MKHEKRLLDGLIVVMAAAAILSLGTVFFLCVFTVAGWVGIAVAAAMPAVCYGIGFLLEKGRVDVHAV